jgi:hypothetical protein
LDVDQGRPWRDELRRSKAELRRLTACQDAQPSRVDAHDPPVLMRSTVQNRLQPPSRADLAFEVSFAVQRHGAWRAQHSAGSPLLLSPTEI